MPNQRQEVTGVVVNERPNVPREYVRQIRAMLHNWETKGYAAASATLRQHSPASKAHARHKGKMPKLERVLAGKIAYLGMVSPESNMVKEFSILLKKLYQKKDTSNALLLLQVLQSEGFDVAANLNL